jgi:hypothetical protein
MFFLIDFVITISPYFSSFLAMGKQDFHRSHRGFASQRNSKKDRRRNERNRCGAGEEQTIKFKYKKSQMTLPFLFVRIFSQKFYEIC